MSARFHSVHWGRVAAARPALSPAVQVFAQHSRGEAWTLLHDTGTGASFRLNAAAWQLIGRLDGTRTVEAVWQAVVALDIEDAPSQDETIQLIATLGERGLLATDTDDQLPGRKGSERDSPRRRRNGFNPLAIRIPLGDPSRIIDIAMPVYAPFAGRLGWWLWCLLMATAAVLFAAHAEALLHALRARAASPAFLFALWLAWPLMKAAHELAHGLVLVRGGGRTEEWGITWWIVAASPYVDASSALVLADRRQRLLVSAAGVMAELALAAIALGIWCVIEPGVLRDAALAVMVIGTISTLVVNANPLMRSDGYAFAIDALDLPNLDTRAHRHVREQAARWLLGMKGSAGGTAPPPLAPTRREAAWYVAFVMAAAPYRMAVTLTIIGWISTVSAVLAVAGCAWAAWRWVVLPASRLWRLLSAAGVRSNTRWRGVALAASLASLVVAVVLTPAPRIVVADGLVWVPEGTLVRALADGVVAQVFVHDRQPVRRGAALMRLENPALDAELEATRARRRAAEAEWLSAQATRSALAASIEEQIAGLHQREAWLAGQIEAMLLKAPADGVIALHLGDHLMGRFVPRGTALGHVVGAQTSLVRAVLDPADAPAVSMQVRQADVRLAQNAAWHLPAAAVSQQPAGVHELPARLLGDRGGGSVATDPADAEGLRTLRQVFVVDVALDRPLERIGGRAQVRFDLGSEAIGVQAWRRLRQLVLSHVAV